MEECFAGTFRYTHAALLAADALGYLIHSNGKANMFFHVADDRYGTGGQ